MPKKEHSFATNHYMLKSECKNVHEKIDRALWGLDGRGGMVKDLGDIKNFMQRYEENHSEEKTDKKESHKALTALCYSIIGGVVVAGVNYMFLLFNP